ncbi:MAG: hypothetical protein IPH84_16800 [Bacteroidales bacterium]|nr:hypothetical protein [Bacteroidales bacterium]
MNAAAYVLYPGNSNAGELTQIPNIPNNPTITFRGLETVSVSAKNIWPSSSVDVKIGGEHINIATGAWCHASSGPEFGLFGPNGFSRIGGSDVVLPGTNVGALIGRINNGTPFIVGSTLDLITSESGILEFSMNDAAGQYSDNVGSLIVSLRR